MIRQSLSIAALAGTFVALIATSPPPQRCATEAVNVLAETSCGQPANVVLSSTAGCSVTATGAGFGGLPTSGRIDYGGDDAGLREGFTLSGANPDGGASRSCHANPADGGFTIECGNRCSGDAGCPDFCSGTLTFQ